MDSETALVEGVLLGGVLRWFQDTIRHHIPMLKRAWEGVLAHPRTLSLRHRTRPLERFVRARLSPEEALGLHLTLGALILIATSWLFGIIAREILAHDPLAVLDQELAQWLHARATPSVTTIMLAMSALGSFSVMALIALSVALFLGWQHAWDRLLALILAVPGGMLLSVCLKLAFQRGRPVFDEPLLVLTTYSFPSGHALGSTVLYGFLAVYLVRDLHAWHLRLWILGGVSIFIGLIGFTRLYLGVHYLSDVLGGMVAGVAWLALCLTAVETWRRRRYVRRRVQALQEPPR